MILRELLAGSAHFNEIHRGVPLMSRALLAQRLRQLEESGVIARVHTTGERGHHYTLTPAGEEFRPVLEALGRWGQRWTVRVQRCNLDAGFLMWNVRRRIDRERLPDQRVVVATLATLDAAVAGVMERTALILVGRAIGAEEFDESRLYAGDYDRRFRPVGIDPRFPEGA